MSDISRRQLLVVGVGAVAAAALPLSAITAAPVAAAPNPNLLAWAVGTPGEFDWVMVKARTAGEAVRRFACETVGGDGCEDEEAGPDGCGECDWCYAARAEAERRPEWDGKAKISSADWLRIGMGCICARCGDEVYVEDQGVVVGDDGIHDYCMSASDAVVHTVPQSGDGVAA